MVKKVLFRGFLPVLFFLMPQFSFAQSCPTFVGIESSATSICEGESISFTADPNTGTNLHYQWKVNGTPRGSGRTISISDLEDGDLVKVEVTSADSPGCKKSSKEVEITVRPNRTGTVKIQANSSYICTDETVILSISSLNPVSSGTVYKWQLTRNGNVSTISNDNNVSTDIFQDGDKIQLLVESSSPCVAPFSSNIIEITESTGPPAAPGSISGDSVVCPGNQVTYSAPEVDDATEYVWSLPTGWSGSSETNEIFVTAGTGSGDISVRTKNACGESVESIFAVSARPAVPDKPEGISGATETCPGVTETYSIPELDRATEYLWKLPAGWTGTSTTNSITVTTGPSGSGAIEVLAKNSCGTGVASTLPVLVQSGAPTAPSHISGPSNVCPGSTATYSIPEVPGASEYIWELPSDWTGTSNTNSITVTASASGNGEVSVKTKNGCGISSSRKLAVSVDWGDSGGFSIDGNSSVCAGSSAGFSVNPSYDSYTWTLPPGWSMTKEEGNKIEVVSGDVGEDGTIKVTAKTSCGNIVESSISVEILSGLTDPDAISGPTEVCSTQTGIVYSLPSVEGATGYEWVLPQEWKLISGEGTNSVEVDASYGTGSISVTARNECGESKTQTLTVKATSAQPDQPGEIRHNLGSDFNICQLYGEATFSVPAVPKATGYNWILPTGWEITSGWDSRSITVKLSSPDSISSASSIQVAAFNSCGSSPTQSLENIVCEGTPQDLEGRMKIMYVRESRELIIQNPALYEIESVHINNLLGQELDVYSNIDDLEQITLPVKQFSPGVYLARVYSENGILTKQIILE